MNCGALIRRDEGDGAGRLGPRTNRKHQRRHPRLKTVSSRLTPKDRPESSVGRSAVIFQWDDERLPGGP